MKMTQDQKDVLTALRQLLSATVETLVARLQQLHEMHGGYGQSEESVRWALAHLVGFVEEVGGFYYITGTNWWILAKRREHRVVAQTAPQDDESGLKMTVVYKRWDDGVVTTHYDGVEVGLVLSNAVEWEKRTQPEWELV